jgi:RimJ/RimL family protein N-acetyltransferase
MLAPTPVTLEGHGVRLEPLTLAHTDALTAAASDGRLWELWFTSVPAPHETRDYIEAALEGQRAGHMLPWVVRDLASDTIVGSTRYHDIVPAVDRVEIGYTFYAASRQRSHVNSACK